MASDLSSTMHHLKIMIVSLNLEEISTKGRLLKVGTISKLKIISTHRLNTQTQKVINMKGNVTIKKGSKIIMRRATSSRCSHLPIFLTKINMRKARSVINSTTFSKLMSIKIRKTKKSRIKILTMQQLLICRNHLLKKEVLNQQEEKNSIKGKSDDKLLMWVFDTLSFSNSKNQD